MVYIPQRPYNKRYINLVNDLPSPVNGVITLSENNIWILSNDIDIGSNSIMLGDNDYLIGELFTSNIISTSTNVIQGNDWNFRVYGIKVNGKNIGLSNMPEIRDAQINSPFFKEGLYAYVKETGRIHIKNNIDIFNIELKKKWNVGIYEDFSSGDLSNWNVANDTTNQWIVSNLDFETGGNSMFVSNDGTNNNYDGSVKQYSHIYKTLTFNQIGRYEFMFELNYKGLGVLGKDQCTLSLVKGSHTIRARRKIRFRNSGDYSRFHKLQPSLDFTFLSVKKEFNLKELSYHFVISWENDNDGVVGQPPINIDLIKVLWRIY